ncbi:MAG: penicillin-binding protein [Gemmatimonadota bacterium]
MSKRTGRKNSRRKGSAVSRTHAFRCGILSAAALAAGLFVTARAFQLQVLQGEQWNARAVSQTTEVRELPAARGGLFDRNGRPLAVSREHHAAFYAPVEIVDEEAALTAIEAVLDPGDGALRRLRRAESGWVSLGRVDGRTRERLARSVRRGLHFQPVPARNYPEGHLAAGLLGALDATGRGQSGLELVLDSLLTGVPGEMTSRRDALGATYPLRHANSIAPQPGRDVYLTIDAELQEIAEGALENALAATGASGGDVILADPRTGEVLAVASYAVGAQQRIPAFTDPYEPGSTTKPFLLATLLEEGIASLDDTVDVEGGEYATSYRTITDVHEYDSLTVEEVIRYSSNVGAAKLADRIGSHGLQYAYLRDFGFGTPTGIEMASEASGVLHRPERWTALSPQSLAFGYEMTVTSMQLVAAYGALANQGVLLRPTLIKGIRDASGRRLFEHRPRALRRIVTTDVAREITGVLAGVVRSGTGDEASLRTIDIAGKTGTSRISADGGYAAGRYVASFVGYVPADDPQLVVLAKLTDPKSTIYGGGAAAPVSRTVVQAILSAAESGLVSGRVAAPSVRRYDWDASPPRGDGAEPAHAEPFRLAALNPAVDGNAESRLRTASESEDVVLPDLSGLGMRAAVARLLELGLRVEVQGSGRVERTEPAPGARVVPGARVLLR